jgi:DNA repair exonuclease SbcCD ATPase subunit
LRAAIQRLCALRFVPLNKLKAFNFKPSYSKSTSLHPLALAAVVGLITQLELWACVVLLSEIQLQRITAEIEKLVASSPDQIDQITSDNKELTAANETLQRLLREADESMARLADSKQVLEFAKGQFQREDSQREKELIEHISTLNEKLATASKTITSHETLISRLRKKLKAKGNCTRCKGRPNSRT